MQPCRAEIFHPHFLLATEFQGCNPDVICLHQKVLDVFWTLYLLLGEDTIPALKECQHFYWGPCCCVATALQQAATRKPNMVNFKVSSAFFPLPSFPASSWWSSINDSLGEADWEDVCPGVTTSASQPGATFIGSVTHIGWYDLETEPRQKISAVSYGKKHFCKFSEPLMIINGRKVQWFSFAAEFLPNSAPNNQGESLAEVKRKQCAVIAHHSGLLCISCVHRSCSDSPLKCK